MNLYEVGVYNKYVRDAVRQGNDLPFGMSSKWEEVYLLEFEFSPTLGYVVDGIIKISIG